MPSPEETEKNVAAQLQPADSKFAEHTQQLARSIAGASVESPAPILAERKKSTITVGSHGLQLTTLPEMWRFAEAVIASRLNPKSLDTVEKVFIAIQMGAEVGLPPMAAIQNIAVINNRAAIWGDAMLAIPMSLGLVEDFKEEQIGEKGKDSFGYRCTTKRRGMSTVYTQEFTVEHAKKAGLWSKEGPWQQYPERMLKLRARGFNLRDAYPDALRGMISVEEARDTPAEPRNVTASMSEDLK